MPDNPVVLILLLIALLAVGGYLIYLVLRPKSKASSKQVRDKQQADAAATVDKVLRDAHINPSGDFHVGRDRSAEGDGLTTDALLTADALSKRLEHNTRRHEENGHD